MSADIELHWEWPADRVADKKLLVKIDNVKKQSAGVFDPINSPSIVENLPDPRVLSGTVFNTTNSSKNKSMNLTLPLLEIEGIKTGSYVVLGIVDNDTCICIAPVDGKNADLNSISCP